MTPYDIPTFSMPICVLSLCLSAYSII